MALFGSAEAMNMHAIDWAIVAALIGVLLLGALSTRRYTKSVAAFLAAQRCGGRYLLSVAMSMAMMGVISLVGYLEQYHDVGYNALWWGFMEGPMIIIMGVSGWVFYRFRQTRALTLAQFFEVRYSKNFRVFSGLLAFLAGIVNFGIFPSVGARFFIWYCGLPETFHLAGLEISTFATIMASLLGTSLLFTFLGGQIAVMVTDFIQGSFAFVVFAIVIGYLLYTFSWGQISDTLLATEPGKSLINPFDMGKEENFNIWFYLISIVIFFYCAMGWQGTAGYYSSAKSPHESKMAMMLSHWRYRVLMLVVLVVPLCLRTYLHHPDYAEASAAFKAKVAAVAPDNLKGRGSITDPDDLKRIEALQSQAKGPLFMGMVFPKILLGLMCAAMLGAFISTHDTYLHSWGGMFIQDVILPFRRKPLSTAQHLWLLRFSILGVAVFIFFFSLYFQHVQRILMFCALSASIFVGGAGAVIIGGLYWKRGTTKAAWTAMIMGLVLTVVGFWIQHRGAGFLAGLENQTLVAVLKPIFTLTGQEMSFWVIVVVILSYLAVSLLGRPESFNLDRMLHRGKYAVAGEASLAAEDRQTILEKLGWTKEFTRWDKVVAGITLSWPLIWFVVFIIGNTWHLLREGGIPKESWLSFWHYWTWFIYATSIVVTAWFIIGGLYDIVYMYRRLRTMHVDDLDDGRVIDRHSAGEELESENGQAG
jgi:SSS family solute:Na+ symporter